MTVMCVPVIKFRTQRRKKERKTFKKGTFNNPKFCSLNDPHKLDLTKDTMSVKLQNAQQISPPFPFSLFLVQEKSQISQILLCLSSTICKGNQQK